MNDSETKSNANSPTHHVDIESHVAAQSDEPTSAQETRTTRSKSSVSDKPDDLPHPQLEQNDIAQAEINDEADRDDSEAETVLSSPVKRREALKKTNGTKSRLDETSLISEIKVNGDHSPSIEPQLSPHPSHDRLATNRRSSKASLPNSAQSPKGHESLASDNDDSDESLSSHAATASSISGREAKERQSAPRENGNPRKRKHSESIPSSGKRAKTDLVKRSRRSSELKRRSSDRSSEELSSPPPRLRRHKRTTSGGTHNDEEIDVDRPTNRNGRTRRAASTMAAQDQKASRSPLSSDLDSDDDINAQPQARSTRSLNRSVSTPGRPGGRDHKRHVNKYGFTRLAEACENGDVDLVKEWRHKDPEQLEQREFAGNTPLQVAALNGYPDVVAYLLSQDVNPHCANTDKDTPLIDAVENGHSEVVQLLLDAGVDPMRQNMKGQQALDVITDETENGTEIRLMLKKAIEQWKSRGNDQLTQEEQEQNARPGPRQGLHFMARTADNLLKLVANNDREGVQQFLDARVPVDNTIVAAAAKTGDIYLVNMLLAEMSPKKARSRPEKPMLSVIGSSHFEMVKTLTELDAFNPTWRSKANGKTWFELAELREGPHWKEERELLHKLYTSANASSRLSSSPVSKRDVGARRLKSPVTSRDSDEELEDDGSPDPSRAKRKLVSRKNMRASNGRKSPSAGSSRAASSPETVMKPAEDDPTKIRRKPGRPRTKSMSQQGAPEIRTKRIKSGNEKLAMFESKVAPKRRKMDDTTSIRPASESVSVKSRKNSLAIRAGDVEMAEVKVEEDTRAEAERAQAEELARLEKEAEEVRSREIEAAAERARARLEKLDSVPSALRRVLTSPDSASSKTADFAAGHFLPLHAAPATLLWPDGDDEEDPNGHWISSYQAAGLLQHDAADRLLGLDVHHSSSAKPLIDGIASKDVAPFHRQTLITLIGAAQLSEEPLSLDSAPVATLERHKVNKALRQRVAAEHGRFMTLQPMRWLNLKDFLSVKAKLQVDSNGKYPHLRHLPALKFVPITSFDDSPFAELPSMRTTNGTHGLPRPSSSVVDDQMRNALSSGLKEGDGQPVGGSTGAMRGFDKVETVVD